MTGSTSKRSLPTCTGFYGTKREIQIPDVSNPVLFADDTSLIMTNYDSQMFEKDINTAIL